MAGGHLQAHGIPTPSRWDVHARASHPSGGLHRGGTAARAGSMGPPSSFAFRPGVSGDVWAVGRVERDQPWGGGGLTRTITMEWPLGVAGYALKLTVAHWGRGGQVLWSGAG